jgi:hypothetical protein
VKEGGRQVGSGKRIYVWMEDVQIETRGIEQKRFEKEQGELQ